MDPLEIDGSYGEGGGQILRTAMAFSVITTRSIHVTKIRLGREQPGLRPQHAAALLMLKDLCGGTLEGASIGSTEVSFIPGERAGPSMKVNLMTAASITLVLQALVPAVSLSGSDLRLELIGGTDVPWSPPFDYCATVVREGFRMIGVSFSTSALRRGYYPKGGGRVVSSIERCSEVRAIELAHPPQSHPVTLTSRCGKLPRHVAERQANSAQSVLEARGIEINEVEVTEEGSDSPGSSIVITEVADDCLIGADALGARGKPAEKVGREAADSFVETRASGAAFDARIADMVAPFLSLAKDASRIRIPIVSRHLETGLHVAQLFTSCDYSWQESDGSFLLSIEPSTG
jgi:RNA 3'-phosphate cyclase